MTNCQEKISAVIKKKFVMKKYFLIVLSSLVCLFTYSANVPKVNNHGFPQNLRNTSKKIVIEYPVTDCQTQCVETHVPVKKQKNNRKSILNNVIEKSSPIVNNESVKNKVNSQTNGEQIKKDIKTQKKEIKNSLKGSKSNEHNLAYIFASVGLGLIALSYYVLWPLMFVGFAFSVAALVMGILNGDTKSIIFGSLGIFFFIIELVLIFLLLA